MEDSTSRAAAPGKPAGGAPQGWRRLQQRVTSFLEAVGEILRGMDEARHVHPTISAYHDPRR
ncbi:XRE family transcriptional regulator [Bordetella petrii]|nr:XRE family transcriptional regulator [Bordetella petrii]